MRLSDLFENDREHQKTLDATGWWGKSGAGCIFIAKDTGRILLNHRSSQVEQPNTWGVWGGAIDSGESPLEAVKREAKEEAGFIPSSEDIIPIYVFHDAKSGFKYYNYLIVVDAEFEPKIPPENRWETQGWDWFDYGKWPSNLHFGVKAILNDAAATRNFREPMMKISPTMEERRP
jgi:8-oxo-dGTP pyrophosphatase MutT (NUDIX family)